MKTEKKVVLNGHKTTYSMRTLDVFGFSDAMSHCVNKGLGAGSFVGFIELRFLVDDIIQNRQKSMKILMESYGILKPITDKITGPRYHWADHAQSAEIQEKVNALNNKMVELSPINFIPSEEFQAFTSNSVDGKPVPMDLVVNLAKVLMKK